MSYLKEFDILKLYRQAYESGDVILGDWMLKNFAMVQKGLDDEEFFYDSKKAHNACLFIDKYLRFVEGADKPFKLELWQKYIISCIFGLVDPDGGRHFKEFVLVCGRKQGKSALVAAIEVCVAYTQDELGMQIFNMAPKLDQANIIFEQACNMIDGNPRLKRAGKKRRTDFYIPKKKAKIKPLAFNAKKADGYNPYFACFDEFAAWPGAKSLNMYNVMLSGQGARREPINILCSTANFEDGGLYDLIYRRATNVLNGDSEEKRILPFLYQIDDLEKWDDIQELRKALPNLGVSFYEQNLKDEIVKAHEDLVYRGEFITKYCNIKQNSTFAWLTEEQIKSTICPAFDLRRFEKMCGVGGVDLSQTTDLTAACVVLRVDNKDYVLSHFWLPEAKIQERSKADNIDYPFLVQKGLLTLSGEKFVDYKDVTRWFVELRNKYKIQVLVTGYDRYSSTYFVDEMQKNGFLMDDVIQGTNLTPILDEFQGLISAGRVLTGNNGLMQVHLRNGAVQHTAGDNRMRLVKLSREKHIDGLAALIDAMTVRSKYLEQFKYRLFANKFKEDTE